MIFINGRSASLADRFYQGHCQLSADRLPLISSTLWIKYLFSGTPTCANRWGRWCVPGGTRGRAWCGLTECWHVGRRAAQRLHAAINTPAHTARISIYRQQGDECEYAKGTTQAGSPERIKNPLCLTQAGQPNQACLLCRYDCTPPLRYPPPTRRL